MNNKTNKAPALRCEAMVRRKRYLWNKCQECGRLISYSDIETGKAINRMITPYSDVSYESWETLCRDHYKPNKQAEPRPGDALTQSQQTKGNQ